MERQTGQYVVMSALFVLVVVLVGYLYVANRDLNQGLRGDVTSVIGQNGYAPIPQVGYSPTDLPASRPPLKKEDIGNLEVVTYLYGFKEAVILNSLPLRDVATMDHVVRWVPDPSNKVAVEIADVNALRTYFFAPEQDVDLKFKVEKRDDAGNYIHIADYIIKVFSPESMEADVNDDGRFTFQDLIPLMQKWNTYGERAMLLLTVIMSRYES